MTIVDNRNDRPAVRYGSRLKQQQEKRDREERMSSSGEYIYNWWDECGKDPFESYLENPQERRELEAKIQVAINLAINRPSKDPLAPNQPLIDFAKDLARKYKDKPFLLGRFYRVAALPDPLDMEKQRIKKEREERREQRRKEAYNRLSEQEKAEYDRKLLASVTASHSGHWQYHDDDCLCWKYFDDSHCNRGGYSWSCCGATSESSGCYKSSAVNIRDQVPIPGYVEEEIKDNEDEEAF